MKTKLQWANPLCELTELNWIKIVIALIQSLSNAMLKTKSIIGIQKKTQTLTWYLNKSEFRGSFF